MTLSRRVKSPQRHRLSLLAATVTVAVLTGCGSTVATSGQQNSAPAGTGVPHELAGDGLTASTELDGAGPQPGVADSARSAGSAGAGVAAGAPGAAAPSGAAASGGASGRSGAGGSTTSSGGTSADARNTATIQLGVLAAGDPQEGAKQAGASSGTSVSAGETLKAVLAHYKERGGIAGRPIKEVFREIPVTTTNYNTYLQSACALFTEDNKSEAVVTAIGFYSASFEACLDRRRTPHIEGMYGGTDEQDLARFRNYYLPGMATYDDRFRSTVASGLSTGRLKRGMKVGVLVEDCPHIQRAFKAVFAPAAKAGGLVLDTFERKCVEGFQDAGDLAAANQAAVNRFRANGVETVMFATYPTGVDLAFFTPAASSQGWKPKYYLDSLGLAAGGQSSGTYSADQLPQMHGVGWVEAFDVSRPTFDSPTQKRCLTIMKDRVRLQTALDHYLAFAACDAFFLLEAALMRSGGDSASDQIRAAVAALGSGHGVAALSGKSLFAKDKRYGVVEYTIFGWSDQCRCFVYTGAPRTWQ